ncbi:winged helix-turn-helix transcriptional regulator [Granulicella aggregans]|uniref:winged helix-turn-helix transcriptional regulator n=1 Tax=Granulicella aggregans TaxID=474949 RepID=UPI00160D7B03
MASCSCKKRINQPSSPESLQLEAGPIYETRSRKLEVDGIILREDLSEIVLHIEYGLKDRVRDSVCALLDHLAEWGGSYLSQSRTDKE